MYAIDTELPQPTHLQLCTLKPLKDSYSLQGYNPRTPFSIGTDAAGSGPYSTNHIFQASISICMISMNIKQPRSLLSHSLSYISYRVSNTSCWDFMGKRHVLLINLSGSVAVTAALSPGRMVLPSAKQWILEVRFSRALMLISTPGFETPRDFPPHHLYFSGLSRWNETVRTLSPHAELNDFSGVQNAMRHKIKCWESRQHNAAKKT